MRTAGVDQVDQKTCDRDSAEADDEGSEAVAVAVRGQTADHRLDHRLGQRIDEGPDIEGADRTDEKRRGVETGAHNRASPAGLARLRLVGEEDRPGAASGV